jgi:fluoroquinolone transport system permease protein
MKRLGATMWCDLQLQVRNGFYYAAGFVAIFWMLGLRQFPSESLRWLMPIFILSNLLINTFYFLAGLVLLEKGEGTLLAQVTSPLRSWEYLAAKVITLMFLSIIENGMIVAVGFGLQVNWLFLLLGIIFTAGLYVLIGFIIVSRYDSINEFLFPSFFYTMTFALPYLDYFELWQSWLMYLHPVQASLLLFKGAFLPVSPWQLGYGLLYAGGWIALLFVWSQRAFARFVIAAPGAA